MAMMKNRIPLILLLNIAGVALFCSWYLPANHGAWLPVDSALFHFFNHGVSVSHAYAWLLAIINNRAFDACSLLAMGCLMLSYWLKAPTAGRRQIAIMGLVMLLAAVIINQLAQHLMPVQRASPSLFFSDIAVGSLTAVLIGAPWVLMTPLSDKLIAFFDRYLPSRISAK
ncbi:TPA: hypothetical protein L9P70_001977 [Klebsiella pneumoniae]|nr:hypothetical protein [Klebsiella pneumoniae]